MQIIFKNPYLAHFFNLYQHIKKLPKGLNFIASKRENASNHEMYQLADARAKAI